MKVYVVTEADDISTEVCVSVPFKTLKEAQENLSSEYQERLDFLKYNLESKSKDVNAFTIVSVGSHFFYGQIQELEIPDDWFKEEKKNNG